MLQTSASRINALILSFGHREKILSLQVSADYHIGFSSIIIIITLPTRFFCCCHNTQNCFSAVQELHFCILITGNFFFPFVKVLASCFLALLLQQYFYLFFVLYYFPFFLWRREHLFIVQVAYIPATITRALLHVLAAWLYLPYICEQGCYILQLLRVFKCLFLLYMCLLYWFNKFSIYFLYHLWFARTILCCFSCFQCIVYDHSSLAVRKISSTITNLQLNLCLYTAGKLSTQSCSVKHGAGTEQQPEPMLRKLLFL